MAQLSSSLLPLLSFPLSGLKTQKENCVEFELQPTIHQIITAQNPNLQAEHKPFILAEHTKAQRSRP